MKPAFFDLMIDKGLTLASVESVTGGLFAHSITRFPNASKFYQGGLIVYNDKMKKILSDIDPLALKKHKAISKEIAIALANHILTKTDSDIAIAFVGNAGPTAQDKCPVGTMFTVIIDRQTTVVHHDQLVGSRIQNQKEIVALAHDRLLAFLEHNHSI